MSRVDCPTWLHSQALNHGVTLLRAAEKHGLEYVVGKRRSVPQQVWPMRRVAEGEDGRLARSQSGAMPASAFIVDYQAVDLRSPFRQLAGRCTARKGQFASSPSPGALGFAMAHNLADLQTANRHVAEGERRIACQRRRIAEQEGAGHDTHLSRQVLESFELTLELLIEHRDKIVRELAQTSS